MATRKKDNVKAKVKTLADGPNSSTLKSLEEIKQISLAALPALASSGTSVCCWFKDASGGPDFPVPMASADACTAAGGNPTNGECPNTFALLARHIVDLHAKVDALNSRLSEALPAKKVGR